MDHIGMDAGMQNRHVCELTGAGEVMERQTDRAKATTRRVRKPTDGSHPDRSVNGKRMDCVLLRRSRPTRSSLPIRITRRCTRSEAGVSKRTVGTRALADACRLGAYRPAHRTSPTQRDVRAVVGVVVTARIAEPGIR